MASITRSAVVAESAAKMPPQWNQRTPSSSKSCFQFTSPGASCEAADQPRSLQPTAPRRPYPRSVKFKPTRAVRPMPSKGVHLMCERSTPPCSIRSYSRRPTSFSTMALTTVVRRPKQRRNPRTTLYSPPPSHTWKLRAVRMRPSPGSSRSMISPSAAASQRQLSRGLIASAMAYFPPLIDWIRSSVARTLAAIWIEPQHDLAERGSVPTATLTGFDSQCHGLLPSPDRLDQVQCGAHIGGDARIVAGLQQFAAHQVGAHTDRKSVV